MIIVMEVDAAEKLLGRKAVANTVFLFN